MFDNISVIDVVVIVLGLGIINEAFELAKQNQVNEPPPKREDVIYFEDFSRGKAYKRRYDDRHTEVLLEIYPTPNPLGHATVTYVVKVEVIVTGAEPPDELLFWLDDVEWVLNNENKIYPLGGGRHATDYFAMIEESNDPTKHHPPMLQRVLFKGDPSV